MGEVTGTIRFQLDDDSEPEQLTFGEWLLRTIVKNADTYEWVCKREGNNLYVWNQALQVSGKDAQHFRDKEHLHLIDKSTDVAISTKHPQALSLDDRGVYVKRTREDKVPEHLTGTKAVNRGESPEITICTRNKTPDEVVEWQKQLITTLRRETKGWLQEDGTAAQVREFVG